MNSLRFGHARRAGLVLLVASQFLHARGTLAGEPDQPHTGQKAVTVQTDLITPIFGCYYLEADVRASDRFSVLINSSYLPVENHDWKAKAGTLGVGTSYYFQGESLRRWYVEGVGEANLAWWRHEPSGKVASMSVGYTGVAVVGYRFIWNSGAVLDAAVGVVGLHLPSVQVKDTDGTGSSYTVSSDPVNKVYPAAKLNVGWAF